MPETDTTDYGKLKQTIWTARNNYFDKNILNPTDLIVSYDIYCKIQIGLNSENSFDVKRLFNLILIIDNNLDSKSFKIGYSREYKIDG